MKLLEHKVAKSGEIFYLNHRGQMLVADTWDDFLHVCYHEQLFWVVINSENRVGIPLRERERIMHVLKELPHERFNDELERYLKYMQKGMERNYD